MVGHDVHRDSSGEILEVDQHPATTTGAPAGGDVGVAPDGRVVEGLRSNRDGPSAPDDRLTTLELLEAQVDPGLAQGSEGSVDSLARKHRANVTQLAARDLEQGPV